MSTLITQAAIVTLALMVAGTFFLVSWLAISWKMRHDAAKAEEGIRTLGRVGKSRLPIVPVALYRSAEFTAKGRGR